MNITDSIGSILAASLCTYGIDKPGGVRGYAAAADIKFTDDPIAIYVAPMKYDACYVAETDDAVILAFRGTSVALKTLEDWEICIEDWLNNFIADPVSIPRIPGMLHDGFSSSVERLWHSDPEGDKNQHRKMSEEVEHRMAGGKPLVITGYSKGGALAPIAAAFFHKLVGVDPSRIIVRMFEGARAGDATFKRYFNDTFHDALRYEYQDDIVPHVPPVGLVSHILGAIPYVNKLLDKVEHLDEWNYASVGQLKFVNWGNSIVENDDIKVFGQDTHIDKLPGERVAHLIELIAKFNGKFFTDHSPENHLYPILVGKPFPEEMELTVATPQR